MLTIDDVVLLNSMGVGVKVKRKFHPLGPMGEWDFNEYDVILYLTHIHTSEDFDITLLHEFIHARNYMFLDDDGLDDKIDYNDDEDEVEAEAKETYLNAPDTLTKIKEIYKLKKFKFKS